MDTKSQLDKVHELELKIALEIKRICEKNSIPYFLTAGSTLGAVRHGGFIPWDDDMDIGMLRADYLRFIDLCRTDLGKEYFLQTWDTDPDYPFSFGKIRLKGTHMVECFSEEQAEEHNGIFVDIFPYDNVPDNNIKKKLQSCKYYFCKRLLWIKKGYGKNMKHQSVLQKSKYYVFLTISKLFRYAKIKDYFIKTQLRYNNTNTEKVVTDGSYSYKKESINRAWVENLELVRFESDDFFTYKDRLKYLEHFYGDYMKLPSEEKRNRHEMMKVDFGPYKLMK